MLIFKKNSLFVEKLQTFRFSVLKKHKKVAKRKTKWRCFFLKKICKIIQVTAISCARDYMVDTSDSPPTPVSVLGLEIHTRSLGSLAHIDVQYNHGQK